MTRSGFSCPRVKWLTRAHGISNGVFTLSKGIGMSRIPLKKVKKLHIIINPASGKMQPILPIINAVMKETHIDWEILITKKPHDASKFAGKAIKEGVDAVAVYGGDGTVMEAMQAMIGSETPLAILPGGTGNVLANELKISTDLKQACELILKDSEVRPIDLGKFDEQFFVIRVGLGFEAQMIKGAQRDIKINSASLRMFFRPLRRSRRSGSAVSFRNRRQKL